MRTWILALTVILCLGVGFTAGLLTDTGTTWFLELNKPVIYPPGYLFGLVWTVLYLMMGVSLYLIIEKTKERLPFLLFGAQLVLNFLWTLIFFGLQNIILAIAEIIALWGMILWTILTFKKYSKPAAILLVPYILWVTFATVLTVWIYAIN